MTNSSLISRMREELRLRHYSPETERAYVGWVVRYVRFHDLRHPLDLSRDDLLTFLAALAVEHGVSASTQNQALAAVNFLYRDVLQRPLDEVEGIVRAKRPARLPVVLTKGEVRAVLGQMHGTQRLVATLLYGSGLRVLECLHLRIKDVDLASHQLLVKIFRTRYRENTRTLVTNGLGNTCFLRPGPTIISRVASDGVIICT